MNRACRIITIDGYGLLVSDSVGRIHILNPDLDLTRSSPVVDNGRPVYGLIHSDEYVVGRDILGNIFRWSFPDLLLLDRLDSESVCDRSKLLQDESPSPIISRGIALWDGRVYVSSGYLTQILEIDLVTFNVVAVHDNPGGESPIEWVCTDRPGQHLLSDKRGNIRFGDLSKFDFPSELNIDTGNVHRIVYDSKHDRFWASQDFGEGDQADIANGIVIVDTQGSVVDRRAFARDDVEFVALSRDCSRAYAGGFDGELFVFDNTTPELRIERVIKGFSHQLSDLAVGEDESLYVLTQDGRIEHLTPEGEVIGSTSFARQCVWDIQKAPWDSRSYLCATDTGVTTLELTWHSIVGPQIRVVETVGMRGGFVRRIAALADGFIAITREGLIHRANRHGEIQWTCSLGNLVHTVAVSPDEDEVIVTMNDHALILDSDSGEMLKRIDLGLPVWACAYFRDGRFALGTRNGKLLVFSKGGVAFIEIETGEYPKRMWTEGDCLFVTGDGGVKLYDSTTLQEIGRWGNTLINIMSNTCENATVTNDIVAAQSYDRQLIAYKRNTGEIVGLIEDLSDFPKAAMLLTDPRPGGESYALVGGRGGYISIFSLAGDGPHGVLRRVRDVFISPEVVLENSKRQLEVISS